MRRGLEIMEYTVEKVQCKKIVNSVIESNIEDYQILKRGLIGKVAIRSFFSYQSFSDFFKNVSINCQEIVKLHKCKRMLCIVVLDEVTDDILQDYQKILMFDKEFNLEQVSYEVLFYDKHIQLGYFGGINEKGRTLMYKDTMKLITD